MACGFAGLRARPARKLLVGLIIVLSSAWGGFGAVHAGASNFRDPNAVYKGTSHITESSTGFELTGTMSCTKGCSGQPASGFFTVVVNLPSSSTSPCPSTVSGNLSVAWSSASTSAVPTMTGKLGHGGLTLTGTLIGQFQGQTAKYENSLNCNTLDSTATPQEFLVH
jgi:hypothetical protein